MQSIVLPIQLIVLPGVILVDLPVQTLVFSGRHIGIVVMRLAVLVAEFFVHAIVAVF